jgi:hypothetical protein
MLSPCNWNRTKVTERSATTQELWRRIWDRLGAFLTALDEIFEMDGKFTGNHRP